MSGTAHRKHIGAALLVVLAATVIVAPATASSRGDEVERVPHRRLVVHRTEVLVAVAELQVDVETLRRAQDAAIRAERVLERRRAAAAVDLPDTGALRKQVFLYHYERHTGARPTHPVATAIDIFVELAKLPGQGALVVQHLVEAFAKVTPRVLRSLL